MVAMEIGKWAGEIRFVTNRKNNKAFGGTWCWPGPESPTVPSAVFILIFEPDSSAPAKVVVVVTPLEFVSISLSDLDSPTLSTRLRPLSGP